MYFRHLDRRMKNSFYVTAYRFHTKEKDKLLIIGYFQNNVMEGNCPVIMLGEKELSYTSEEHQLNPVFFKEINGKKITQEYFLWTSLPENWREHKEIKVFDCFSEGRELVIRIDREKLIDCARRIAKNIDATMIEQDCWKLADELGISIDELVGTD